MDHDPEQALESSLAGISELAPARHSLAETLLEVATFATTGIPGADGAGLTLLQNDRADTVVASADFVRSIDEVQYRLGEGPCLDAVDTGLTKVAGSLGDEARWPRFGPQAARLGVRSALSLPLRVLDRVIGSLNVYGHAPHAFAAPAIRKGELLARPAAAAAVDALLLATSGRVADQLDTAVANRAVIDQAIGILIIRSRIGPAEAFEQLRYLGQAAGTGPTDAARRLVEDAHDRAREPGGRPSPR